MFTARSCYFCATSKNRIILHETTDRRFGRPVIPEEQYRLARCGGCQCLYVDSDVTDAYLSALYVDETIDSVSSIGFDHSNMVGIRLAEFERHWRLMRSLRIPAAGERLLDLGCQTGEFGVLAKRSGVVPSGIELSAEYARTAEATWGVGSKVYHSPLDPALDGATFEYITAFETLEHMVDPVAMLQRLRTWLTADGLLALSVPSAQYFTAKAGVVAFLRKVRCPTRLHRITDAMRPVPHVHVYTPSRASCLLALGRAGFRPIYVGTTGWHGPLRHLNFFASGLACATRQRALFAPSILILAVPSE